MNRTEYLLACLAEECAEVVQAATKCQRFGILDAHPDKNMLPNNKYLVREINDVLGVIELMVEEGLPLMGISDKAAIEAKKLRIENYMYYSEARGCLHGEN